MDRHEQVEQLMETFAERTGLTGTCVPRRYLWTDAFAVCNYLELYRARANHEFLDLTRKLIDQVHDVLGAYAANDSRSGWLGGMDDRQHRLTPTRAGLRIGKSLPERGPGEPLDERREWDRDGQYFHYLTRWMHALARAAEATGEMEYHRWAVDLAQAAFEGFVNFPDGAGSPRMYWKMSIDLDRPLVASMGHHDPLDGWVTTRTLVASAHADPEQRHRLEALGPVFRRMFSMRDLATGDSLGIGGLLVDAWRLSCTQRSAPDSGAGEVVALVDAAAVGLERLARHGDIEASPSHRLAFRELGLCIGLHAARRLENAANRQIGMSAITGALAESLGRIQPLLRLSRTIEQVWLAPENRHFAAWTDHQDINDVMLATSLAPDGYLGPAPDGDQT